LASSCKQKDTSLKAVKNFDANRRDLCHRQIKTLLQAGTIVIESSPVLARE
jgi:hypothetical protein